jgi:4-amino-4-deoxy-L-arabinose transferase-like glycosyltransferase
MEFCRQQIVDIQAGSMSMPTRAITRSDFCNALDDTLSRAHRYSLLLIILVGFLLRWYSLFEGHAYTFFTIKDEITALQYAFGFMAGDPDMYYLGSPALNQGHIPGPLWAMLVAALYQLGGNSIAGTIFLMLVLNTLVIYLVYRLAKHMMSPRYALFSALFYSLSPWAIYYSAGIYNPMVLALFGGLLYLALWQTLKQENSRAILWVMLVAAAVPQFHMIGLFYYPAIVLLLVVSPNRINLRWLTFGVVAGIGLYVPYLIGEITHHWSNLHNVLHGTDKFSSGILKVISIPIGMLTNHPGEWPGYTTAELIDFANRWFGSYLGLLFINIISLVVALIFIISFFKRFYRTLAASGFNLRKSLTRDQRHIFIGVLLVLPLLLYMLTGKAYATRYSIFIFPLLFLLPGLYLSELKNQRCRQILHYTLAAMFVCNIYLVISFYADQNRKLTSSSQFMPAFYKLEALNAALRKFAGQDKRIVVDTSHLLAKDNKYRDITTRAISTYIDLYQTYPLARTKPQPIARFILVATPAKVPTDAHIVYRDNGLLAFTLQSQTK